ncbi:hypothetical protein Tco_0114926 [Tanacetum coccineum]
MTGNEGLGDWDSAEYKYTAGSGGKKEPEALVFHKMDIEEDNGEINLEKNDNLISNDYAVKLCLEYEVRKGKKLVKKELMVLLRGEIYFVQFIINPEEDEFEPGLIFGRSFLHSTNAIVNFEEGTITIKPDCWTHFLLAVNEEGKPNLDDLETLLDFDFDEVPQTETDLPPMMTKDYVIKRNDMGTPIHNSRPIGYQNNTNPAENMTLSTLESVINPFRKISVWKKAVSFLGSLPAKLRDVEWKPDYKLCYSNPELATGQWKTEIRTYDHEVGSSRAKRSRNVETVEEALLPDVHHEFLEWRGCSREAKSRYNSRLATLLPKLIYSPQIVDWQLLHKIGCGDEIDQMLKISLKEAQSDEEIFFSVAWETDIQEKEQKESQKQTNPSTEWKGQSQKSSK